MKVWIVALGVTIGASASATPVSPWESQGPAADPARRAPQPEAQALPDARTVDLDEVTRALQRIGELANTVQLHPEASDQAQAAARQAHAIAPKLMHVAPPTVDPTGIVVAADAMAESARQRDLQPQTRARALRLLGEIQRFNDARAALPPSEW